MRISDWSSDVCSSDPIAELRHEQVVLHGSVVHDLDGAVVPGEHDRVGVEREVGHGHGHVGAHAVAVAAGSSADHDAGQHGRTGEDGAARHPGQKSPAAALRVEALLLAAAHERDLTGWADVMRSEEPTSEIQSL